MADLTPTAPSSGVAARTTGGAGATGDNVQTAPAKVISAPSNLNFNGGTIILGARLTAANADGSLTLRTAAGDLTISTNITIPVNTPLQVQLSPGNPPTATLILAQPHDVTAGIKDGLPVVTQFPDLSQTEETAARTAQTLADLPDLETGTVTRALVLTLPETGTAAAAALPTTAVVTNAAPTLATQLEQLITAHADAMPLDADQLKLLSQTMARQGATPAQVGQLSLPGKLLETVQQTLLMLEQQQSASGAPAGDSHALTLLMALMGQNNKAAASPASLPAATQNALAQLPQSEKLPDGSQLQLRLVKIIPPQLAGQADALSQLTARPGVQMITGEIGSQQINGQPVLQTAQGTMLLSSANNLPPGTKLVFEILTPMQMKAGATAAGVPTASAALLLDAASARNWPQLAAALENIGTQSQDVMRALLGSLPRLNAQLPVASYFFLQALRTGDVHNWLGDKALDLLRRSGVAGTNLLANLESDFKTLSRSAAATQSGDWKNYPIPILGENGIQFMQIHVRDHFQAVNFNPDQARSSDAGDERSTRFLVDMEFSELGALQIDGLLRPTDYNQKQLDIILRTQTLLPQDMRRNLRDLYSNSLETHGIKGALSFQAGFQNWVKLARNNSAHKITSA